jgi:aspartate racemase
MVYLQNKPVWIEYRRQLTWACKNLEKAGARFGLIASNTPHIVFDELIKYVDLPLISIVHATAEEAKRKNLGNLLLLGTKITMQGGFYEKELNNIITPNQGDQEIIDKIIFSELVWGKQYLNAKNVILDIINNYESDGVILGCTELPLLIKQEDTNAILLDTLRIHAEAAVKAAVNEIINI